MGDNSLDSPALFPSKSSDDGFLSGNSLRMIKHVVEKDQDIEFDLRECRRTFGQRYLGSDLDIESVSVLMGHASTKTTESFYSRKRLTKAVESAKMAWKDCGGQYNCPKNQCLDGKNGGQGEIRTRDFCLAKAAIYRADLLAHLDPVSPPNQTLDINLGSPDHMDPSNHKSGSMD